MASDVVMTELTDTGTLPRMGLTRPRKRPRRRRAKINTEGKNKIEENVRKKCEKIEILQEQRILAWRIRRICCHMSR